MCSEEGGTDVLAERKLAVFRRSRVGNYVALFYSLALDHGWTLIDGSTLIGAIELSQRIKMLTSP